MFIPQQLSEQDEADMAKHIAQLELSDKAEDKLAAAVLRDEYDVDDVWIEQFKQEQKGK